MLDALPSKGQSTLHENRHKIEELPKLKWQGDYARFQIVLVKAGLQRVSSLSIYPEYIDDGSEVLKGEINDQQVLETIQELEYLGFESTHYPTVDTSVTIDFANNKFDLSEYEKLLSLRLLDSKTQGAIFGIPQTAIDAFPDDVISLKEIPSEILNDPLGELLPFRLSKANWTEEWETFKKQAQHAASNYPELIKALNLQKYFPNLFE
ncbi:MAG: hypothetical protein Q7R95_10485 [bacterium]|nr:hypothetical protein [bacterium]